MKKFSCLFGMFLFAFPLAVLRARTQDSPPAAPAHVVEVVAKKFEFTPNEIHVSDQAQHSGPSAWLKIGPVPPPAPTTLNARYNAAWAMGMTA